MEAPKPGFTTVSGEVLKTNEYYNLGKYYLKLFFTDDDKLDIICYNMEILNGIKYELTKNLQEIYEISSIFRQYTNMKDLYEFIIDLINDNKYEIKNGNDNNLVFNLTISDIKRNNHLIKLVLYHEKNNNTQEYINILSNEIKNLRDINKNNIQEIKELKEENRDIKEELKDIRNIVSELQKNGKNNNNHKNSAKSLDNDSDNIKLKAKNKKDIFPKNENNGKTEDKKFGNKENKNIFCSICKSILNLKRCVCQEFYCDNCILNNKPEKCIKECFLFNNNSNKLNSLYNISKYPLPKNFKAKIHFTDVDLVRIGLTFDANIIRETKDSNSPNYKIYYVLQDMKAIYDYNNKDWIKYFDGKNKLKNGDDLTVILKDGKLEYLLNGETIGKPYILNSNDINEETMYLLIHRRNSYSQCELKYIYELID